MYDDAARDVKANGFINLLEIVATINETHEYILKDISIKSRSKSCNIILHQKQYW